MSSFNKSAVVRKLTDVNATQPSIQTLSLWILHHKRHATQIVDTWLEVFLKERRPARFLCLTYLANDVVQNCRKRYPPYQDLFRKSMLKAFPHVAAHSDEATLAKFKRVIEVWRERSVYSSPQLEELVFALTSNLKSQDLHLFRDLAATPPPAGTERSPPADSPPSPQDDDADEPTVASILRESPKEEDAVPPKTQELIDLLMKLEEPASADAQVREQIAAFPEAVANPAFLKSIANGAQAEELLRAVKAAESVVSDYCKRLADEMRGKPVQLIHEEKKHGEGELVGTQETQAALSAYLRAQKRKAEKTQDLLNQFKEKRAALAREKVEVYKHYESLPDMDAPPASLSLLPSPSQLFASSSAEYAP